MNQLSSAISTCLLVAIGFCACKSDGLVNVDPSALKHAGSVDERFQSYNLEMVEVLGGKIWKPYQQTGFTSKMELSSLDSDDSDNGFYRTVQPINLYDKKLRNLVAALDPVYIRVSGIWANSVYFQDDDLPELKSAPKGFTNVLTRKQWKGVVDFANALNAKLMTSFAISEGVRNQSGIWTPSEALKLANFTRSVGGKIAAAELFNEPNLAEMEGAPKEYDATAYANDAAAFRMFARQNDPEMLVVGPGNVIEGAFKMPSEMLNMATEEMFTAQPKLEFDVFSYHYYGAMSQRYAGIVPSDISTTSGKALDEEWLNKTVQAAECYRDFRDEFIPGKPIWLTETAETMCGGNPWAATYLDCFRYLDQLGRLAKQGVRVVMHNSLTVGDNSLLDQMTHQPKPNYWAALLWAKFMGKEVYDADQNIPGVYVYAHNMKGQQGGITLLIINTNNTEALVDFPIKGRQYTLTSDNYQGKTVKLNGQDLFLGTNQSLPEIMGKKLHAGKKKLPPVSITFVTFAEAGNKNH